MDGGAICGGVMSFSQMDKGMKKYGAFFGMMSFVMKDYHYHRYVKAIKKGDKKKAKEIFDKYAISQI